MPDESSVNAPGNWPARVRTLWRIKLLLTVIVNVGFWGGYLFLSRHAFLPVHKLPMTRLDDWAGFRPQPWAWVYESVFLITGAIPWLIVTREGLRRYLTGFVIMCGASFAIFAVCPVASPRPENPAVSRLLLFITQVDGPLNAFPSLHAGCLVYTLALARRLFGWQRHFVVRALLVLWAGLILFATLATKQHYALDLLAGGLLGWLADWLAWRNTSISGIAAASNARRSGSASQPGRK
jgi:membrane-associated phospholipid phosphatase